MHADTVPYAFKICYFDSEIKSVQLRVSSPNDRSKDWLNVIGDTEYFKTNDCPVFLSDSNEGLVPIFMSIGYGSNSGVNYLAFVFAPSYDNQDSEKETSLKVGKVDSDMTFVNLSFS